MKHLLHLTLLILLVPGCDATITGTYRAEVEQASPPPQPLDPGYSLDEVRQKLVAEPRLIILRSGSRFETREGDRVIWEGTWRRDGDTLYLRAQTVLGTRVGDALQDDRAYGLRNGTIIDEGVYGYYGLRLVYRKQ